MSNAFGPANSFIMGSMIDDIHNLVDAPINTLEGFEDHLNKTGKAG